LKFKKRNKAEKQQNQVLWSVINGAQGPSKAVAARSKTTDRGIKGDTKKNPKPRYGNMTDTDRTKWFGNERSGQKEKKTRGHVFWSRPETPQFRPGRGRFRGGLSKEAYERKEGKDKAKGSEKGKDAIQSQTKRMVGPPK